MIARLCKSMFSLVKKTWDCLSKWLCHSVFLPALDESSCSSKPLPAFGVVSVFGFIHSNRHVIVSHCCSNLHFPDDSWCTASSEADLPSVYPLRWGVTSCSRTAITWFCPPFSEAILFLFFLQIRSCRLIFKVTHSLFCCHQLIGSPASKFFTSNIVFWALKFTFGSFLKIYVILIWERGEGKQRKKHQPAASHRRLSWEPGSHPRHVRQPGIEPATLRLQDDAPAKKAMLARDPFISFKFFSISALKLSHLPAHSAPVFLYVLEPI